MRCQLCCCCQRGASNAAAGPCIAVGNASPGVGGPSCRSTSLAVGSFRPPSAVDTSFCAPVGYPGNLSPDQLQAYHEFRRRVLSDPDNTYQDMIRSFGAVETEEHAMCRYLRARKFNVDATLQMMNDRSQLWREGATHNFYPDFKDALGTMAIPESVFVSQLHFVFGSVTKSSSCPIMYFSAGRVRADGLECLAPFDNIPRYVWHLVMQKLPGHIKYLAAKNKISTVPIEMLVVADLGGISLNSLRRTLKSLEEAMRVLNVFPEVLSHVVLTNVPHYFMPFWPVIKTFVDKDTAEKFELYANEERGRQRLLELVKRDQLASDYGGAGESTERLMLEQCEPSAKGIRRRHIDILSCRRGASSVSEGSLVVETEEFISVRVYAGVGGRSARIYFTQGDKKRIQLSRDGRDSSHTIFFAQITGAIGQGETHYSVEVERGKGGGFTEHFLLVVDVRT